MSRNRSRRHSKGNQNPQVSATAASASVQELSLASWVFFSQMESYYLTRFKWTGLPESIDERYLERVLMYYGQAVFYKSPKTNNIMGTQVVVEGPLNVYDNPVNYNSIGNNGWFEKIPEGEGIMVWDSWTRKCMLPMVNRYATKMAKLDVNQDINREQQKTITAFVGGDKTQGDLMMLARALGMGEEAIMIDPNLANSNPIQSLSTNVKYLQEEFNADKRNLWNEYFDLIGVEHMRTEKKAHVLQDEANITNDSVAKIREAGLLPRQKAADILNKKFGLNVKVEWRKDELDKLNADTTTEGEGDDNE